jgi:3-oxoadipate enol-lactonase
VRGMLAILRAATGPVDRATRSMAPHVLSAETLRDHPEVVDQWIRIAHEEPKSRAGRIGQLLAARGHDAWEKLPGITASTLVVTGDADRLIAPDNSRLIAERVPGARLRTIPGAAHDFPTDRPDETSAIVREFLLA